MVIKAAPAMMETHILHCLKTKFLKKKCAFVLVPSPLGLNGKPNGCACARLYKSERVFGFRLRRRAVQTQPKGLGKFKALD